MAVANYYCLYMDNASEKNKMAVNRVAFLGLLILGVLVARFLVAVRSGVSLSSPITLAPAGLSVSVPTGNGWSNEQAWTRNSDAFTLGGAFALSPGRPSAIVQCRCRFAAADATNRDYLKDVAAGIEGRILEKGVIETAGIKIDWVLVSQRGILFKTFYATAILPYNRQLDIEVHEATGDLDWARTIFEAIAGSVEFTDNEMLRAGSELISAVKFKGLGRFLDNQNRQQLFLIRNARQSNLGFATGVFIDTGREEQLPFHAAGVLYLRDRAYVEDRATTFYCDDGLTNFQWKTQMMSMLGSKLASSSSTKVALDETGLLTVSAIDDRERTYRPGKIAAPSAVLELLLVQMLESEIEQCFVDMIESDGSIVPFRLSRIAAKEIPDDDQISHGFKLEFFDKPGFYEQIYLDEDNRVVGKLVQKSELLLWERASRQEVAAEYPERADLILHDSGLEGGLEQDR